MGLTILTSASTQNCQPRDWQLVVGNSEVGSIMLSHYVEIVFFFYKTIFPQNADFSANGFSSIKVERLVPRECYWTINSWTNGHGYPKIGHKSKQTSGFSNFSKLKRG